MYLLGHSSGRKGIMHSSKNTGILGVPLNAPTTSRMIAIKSVTFLSVEGDPLMEEVEGCAVPKSRMFVWKNRLTQAV
jgi:hypothetical protein